MSITYYLAGVCIHSLYEAQSKPRNRPRLAIHQKLTLYGIAGLVRRYKCPIFPAERHVATRGVGTYFYSTNSEEDETICSELQKECLSTIYEKVRGSPYDQMKLGDWMRSFDRWIFVFFFFFSSLYRHRGSTFYTNQRSIATRMWKVALDLALFLSLSQGM